MHSNARNCLIGFFTCYSNSLCPRRTDQIDLWVNYGCVALTSHLGDSGMKNKPSNCIKHGIAPEK